MNNYNDYTYEEAINAVRKNWDNLQYVNPEIPNYKNIVLAAVKQDGFLLEHASDDLKNNKEIVLEAVEKNTHALYSCLDTAIVLKVLKRLEVLAQSEPYQDPEVLRYLHPDLLKNKEFVLQIVKKNVYAFIYVNTELTEDKDLILEALKYNSFAIVYASDDLQGNKEIVLEAVKQNGHTLKYAPAFQGNEEIVLEAVKQNGNALKFAPAFQGDEEFVLAAVKQNGNALEFASEKLKSDIKNIKNLIKDSILNHDPTKAILTMIEIWEIVNKKKILEEKDLPDMFQYCHNNNLEIIKKGVVVRFEQIKCDTSSNNSIKKTSLVKFIDAKNICGNVSKDIFKIIIEYCISTREDFLKLSLTNHFVNALLAETKYIINIDYNALSKRLSDKTIKFPIPLTKEDLITYQIMGDNEENHNNE